MIPETLKPLVRLGYRHCLFFRQIHLRSPRALLAVFLAATTTVAPAVAQDIVGRASVIDGDTVEIHGTRIRLFAIDAVESRQSCTTFQGQRWPCGREAAFALADHIAGKTVTCQPIDQDRYGRIVARCYIDDQDIAAWSVAHGWSLAWSRYSTEYLPLQRSAKSLGLGIWSGTFEDPKSLRRTN
jgi:endonuclease YncB( thermonuclease family)